ncbi:Leucine Rich Repeat family protein expressed [Zea mays]|uniref:Leucine Rich Repeat family protein expressed n=2 Tax=Zea mays TaxID=4577 RepID=A0A1D6F7R6_MAIZE|nr:Leucine Rich Repeat family protein expressed [Zea mays]
MPESFDKLEYLIYLNVAQTRIEQAPETIGKIRSLRHLNLSETGVRNLPEAFGGLRGCPVALDYWLNSKHCQGILQRKKNSKAVLELQGLENMRTLGVDNVDRISKKDAEKMQLQRMHKLEHLALRCNTDGKCTSTSREVVEDIFDHLNPNCGLKTLEITRYAGERFPRWMSDSDERRQLKNLAHLRLINLKCKSLQVLGLLPSLTDLEICGMDAITRFGKEPKGHALAFRALKKLTFCQMLNLESWPEDGAKCDSLEELSVIQCPKFQKLSMVACSIKRLNVCMSPHQLFSKEGLSGLANSKTMKSISISLCEDLSSSSDIDGLKLLSSLKKLEISGCDELESLPSGLVENLASLKTLSISRCSKLHRLFTPCDSLEQASMHISGLEELEISGCDELEGLFLDVEGLTSLKRLSVTGRIKLCDSTRRLSSIEVLEISGHDELESLLPGVVDSLPSLMSLSVVSCKLQDQDVLCLLKCTTLRSLRISDCPNVNDVHLNH